MKRSHPALALALLLLLFSCFQLSAQTNLPVLKMAVPEASTSLYQGRIKWITAGFLLAGFELQLIPQPSARALNSAAEGAVDGDLYRTEEAVRNYSTLVPIQVPIATYDYYAWLDPASDCPAHANELVNLRPITIQGSSIYDSIIEKSINGYSQVKSPEAALYSLMAGRGDYIVASEAGVALYGQRTGISLIRCLPNPLFSMTTFTFMHIKHRNKLERLEAGLRQAKNHVGLGTDTENK